MEYIGVCEKCGEPMGRIRSDIRVLNVKPFGKCPNCGHDHQPHSLFFNNNYTFSDSMGDLP